MREPILVSKLFPSGARLMSVHASMLDAQLAARELEGCDAVIVIDDGEHRQYSAETRRSYVDDEW